jgi:uncharacterized membrane protein YphA (DoxX/SURF4 family)
MKVIFWIAYVITVAEFTASPINVLRGSVMHLKRFEEVKFPLRLARFSAMVELAAVAAVIAGLWVPLARLIGGLVLAASFAILLIWAIRAKRPAGDISGLGFFIAGALVVALY